MAKLNIISGNIYHGIRHTIEETDFTIVTKEVSKIIDEGNSILDIDFIPLMPEDMIRLTRYIIEKVNFANKKFTIRTNNDFVIREISNCIILNNVEQLDGSLEDYTEYHKINPKAVNAFYEDKLGNLGKLKVNERGIFASHLNGVIDRQNDNQGKIAIRANIF